MKKIKVYHFNDGIDGVVVAKSLKHASKKLLSTGYYDYSVDEIMKHCKDWWKNEYNATLTDWVADIYKYPKKGNYKKSKVIGWYES